MEVGQSNTINKKLIIFNSNIKSALEESLVFDGLKQLVNNKSNDENGENDCGNSLRII